MSVKRYPAIREPAADIEALRRTAMDVKETLEIMDSQRGNRFDGVVTWQDLIDLGFIIPEQVPRR